MLDVTRKLRFFAISKKHSVYYFTAYLKEAYVCHNNN